MRPAPDPFDLQSQKPKAMLPTLSYLPFRPSLLRRASLLCDSRSPVQEYNQTSNLQHPPSRLFLTFVKILLSCFSNLHSSISDDSRVLFTAYFTFLCSIGPRKLDRYHHLARHVQRALPKENRFFSVLLSLVKQTQILYAG